MRTVWLGALLLPCVCAAAQAQAQVPAAPPADAGAAVAADAPLDAPPDPGGEPAATPTPPEPAPAEPPREPLPEAHRPQLKATLEPDKGVVGDLLRLHIEASALVGDDVTVADQSFAPFEVLDKRARTEPPANGRQRFIFDLELLAFEAGKHAVGPVQLRVVTSEGLVGRAETEQRFVEITSLIANEPDAKPKPPTKPVTVIQEDKRPIYALQALAAAALVALLTILAMRWWQRRERPEPPPPPPRPPWDIAVEKLARLRRQKQDLVDAGQGVEFVDQVSDVVREYLGGCHGFDGLETTTDEMLEQLALRRAGHGLQTEIRAYLGRCDLVKFAKVEPDQDEIDLIFAKAQDLVQFGGTRQTGDAATETTTDEGATS